MCIWSCWVTDIMVHIMGMKKASSGLRKWDLHNWVPSHSPPSVKCIGQLQTKQTSHGLYHHDKQLMRPLYLMGIKFFPLKWMPKFSVTSEELGFQLEILQLFVTYTHIPQGKFDIAVSTIVWIETFKNQANHCNYDQIPKRNNYIWHSLIRRFTTQDLFFWTKVICWIYRPICSIITKSHSPCKVY